MSIIIQLDRPDLRHSTARKFYYFNSHIMRKLDLIRINLVKFRCIPIYPDLSAYYGTMDVFMIAPTGIILKRWENVQTNAGVVSLAYIVNDAPPAGTWKIKAVVMGYESTKTFDVYEFYQWKVEVNVSMPHYFLTTAPGVSGLVVAK